MAKSSKELSGQGLPLHEPQWIDVLKALEKKVLIDVNCVKIGQIVKFSYPKATVNILGMAVLKNGTTSPYPQLQNVPVFTPQGGGACLQFPIAAGDQCIVLFNDRNLDAWFQNGNSQAPSDGRLHDLADAIAIVGFNWSGSTAIPSPSSTEARMIYGGAKVGIAGGLVTIQNGTQSLATILNTMLGAMASATTVAQIASAAGTAQTALALLLY